MYLQESEVLRRQANWRSRSLSRHKQPKLAQLSNALRNTSENRRQRNQRVPVLCRWRMYQNIYSEERHLLRCRRTKAHPPTKLKDHLSYGGRVTLRRCPFFMPSSVGCPGISSQARKDKQACQSNLACLGSRRRQGLEKEQARKNKQAFNLHPTIKSLLVYGKCPILKRW